MRGFTSIEKNNLNLVLAEILIKERINSYLILGYQLIWKGLAYHVYRGKQFQVLKDDYEVLRKKNSQILKRIKSYK